MRNNLLLVVLLVLAGVMSACNGAASAGEVSGRNGGALNADFENAPPVETQLVFGTLMLEGTENEVDAQRAGDLLPLWKAVRSLSDSDSASPDEIEALFDQIQETMSPAQIQAIADMQLTRESMVTSAEELGLELFSGRGQFGEMTPEMQATLEAARESGQMPEGGFGRGEGVQGMGPGGGGGEGLGPPGGGPFGQEGVNPEQLATLQAARGNQAGAGLGIPTLLLDAVIEYLEGKTG